MVAKRRKPAAIVPLAAQVTARKHARRLTSQYHTLTQRLAAAKSDDERASVQAELEQMGGIKAYQQASALNTALNPTSRWAARAIRALDASLGGGQPIRVLEIGAVNTQLLDTPGLAVRAIDLHALHPRIEQCDFFSLLQGGEADPSGACTTRAYDAVVCSMVLNCVPNERKRFEMLVGIRSQLRRGGRAFVTLPRSCLEHSFTMTVESFTDALAAVGLPTLSSATGAAGRPPPSTKIVYFECEASMPDAGAALRFQAARFDARAAHRARGARAPPKAKSAGAHFNVDFRRALMACAPALSLILFPPAPPQARTLTSISEAA